jgi:hypothetical protein
MTDWYWNISIVYSNPMQGRLLPAQLLVFRCLIVWTLRSAIEQETDRRPVHLKALYLQPDMIPNVEDYLV